MVSSAVSPPDEISRVAHDLLRERPHTPDELLTALQAAGLELGTDPHDLLFELLADDNLPVGDRWVNLPSILHGSRWWLDVPADATETLPLGLGVDVLLFWHWDEMPLLDDAGQAIGSLRHRFDASCVCLCGPDGWLAAVAGGPAILTFRREGISIEPATGTASADASTAAAYRAAFDVEAEVLDNPIDGVLDGDDDDGEDDGDDDGDDGDALRLSEPDIVFVQAFTDAHDEMCAGVIPPLPVLLEAAGLEEHDDFIAPAGTDWDMVAAVRRFHSLRSHHELSDDDTTSVMMLLGACNAVLGGAPDALGAPDEEEGGAFVLSLALLSAEVSRVFVHESIERGRTPEDLLRFCAALLEHVGDGPGCSGPEVVAAECYDLLDRTADAIAALERAVRHDQHPRAHAMLAGFAADRGDAQEAARLLRAGNVPPGDARLGGAVWGEIEPFLQRPKAMAERNDPCPCGSGRKYKACHLGKEQHALRDRAAWLYRKGCRFVGEHMLREHGELAMALVDAAGGSPQLLSQVIDSELVYDLTLEELGGFRRYLERRRDLLPHDERELASLWLLADRSVYRVDETGPDWLVLTDLSDDEQVRISHVRGSRLEVGSHVAARLLPVGADLVSYFGYVPVPSGLTVQLLEVMNDGDAIAVAETLGRCFAPDHQD